MWWFLIDLLVCGFLFQIEIKDQLINQCNVEKDREKMKTRKMAAKTEKLVKEKENNLKEKQNIEVS